METNILSQNHKVGKTKLGEYFNANANEKYMHKNIAACKSERVFDNISLDVLI